MHTSRPVAVRGSSMQSAPVPGYQSSGTAPAGAFANEKSSWYQNGQGM